MKHGCVEFAGSSRRNGMKPLSREDRTPDWRNTEGMYEFVPTRLKSLCQLPACLQHARNQWGMLTWGWKPQAVIRRAFSTRGLGLRER